MYRPFGETSAKGSGRVPLTHQYVAHSHRTAQYRAVPSILARPSTRQRQVTYDRSRCQVSLLAIWVVSALISGANCIPPTENNKHMVRRSFHFPMNTSTGTDTVNNCDVASSARLRETVPNKANSAPNAAAQLWLQARSVQRRPHPRAGVAMSENPPSVARMDCAGSDPWKASLMQHHRFMACHSCSGVVWACCLSISLPVEGPRSELPLSLETLYPTGAFH